MLHVELRRGTRQNVQIGDWEKEGIGFVNESMVEGPGNQWVGYLVGATGGLSNMASKNDAALRCPR